MSNQTNMKYDGIIFDIDGTLWSAVASSAKGFNKGLESLNINNRVTPEDVASVTGKPYKEGTDFIYVSYGFGAVEGECKTFDTFASLLDYLMGKEKLKDYNKQ